MKNQPKHEEKNEGSGVAGKVVGLAAIAAAAAGAYFLYGSDDATANRKKLKGWMLHLKADVMDKVENMKDLSEETYDAAVTEIANKYAAMKDINQDELAGLVKRLKSHWKDIKKDIEKAGTSAKEKMMDAE